MSDYLRHLAERALARAPAIQPRVRDIFEPSAIGEGALAELVEARDQAPITIARERREPSQSRVNPQPVRLSPEPAAPVTTPSVASTAEARVTPQPAALPAAALPLAEPPHPSLRADAARIEQRTLLVEQPIPSPSSGQPQVHVQEPSAPPKRESRIGPSDKPAVRAAISEPTSKTDPTAHQAERKRTDEIHATSRPRIEPAVAKPLPIAPAVAPTIRVTIGRVEVRAIVAAPPPARPPPAPRSSGALSLDEYFARRKGARP